MTTTHALGPELEAALVRALADQWMQINWGYFREALARPTFALVDSTTILGRFVPETRTIEIARALVLEHPWGVVVEVLKHEVAHQFVSEVLGGDRSAHGPAFRDVCARLGIDAAASGLPTSVEPTDDEARILEKIAKLLALAESPNVHEAEAAMAAAQKLLLKHNLEHRAQAHDRGYAFRHVGPSATRHAEHEKILATLLAKHFFVEAIWIPVYLVREGRRGSVLELCGSPANLEIAEYVHGYLLETGERLWRDHRREKGVGDRDRRTFLSGVMTGFAAKLAREASRHREAGLVWVADADLEAWFGTRHPRVRTFRYGGGPRREAFAHGRAAGEAIVLHRGVNAGPVARGRLLGS
jgi:hypothetical protein